MSLTVDLDATGTFKSHGEERFWQKVLGLDWQEIHV